MSKLNLLVIDDHKTAREALVQRLAAEKKLSVKGVPASAPEALFAAMDDNPDIVLLDVKTSLGNGLKLCKKLVTGYPTVRILALVSCASEKEQKQYIQAGAESILFKDLNIELLLDTLRLRTN